MIVSSELLSRAMEDGGLICFFHAQRTGGSELRQFFVRAYGQEAVYAAQYVQPYKKWLKLTSDDIDAFRVFVGTDSFKPKDLGRPVTNVGIVREPFFRTVSIYNYCKTKFGHPLRDLALGHNFEDFFNEAVKIRPQYLINMCCRRLCGEPSYDAAMDSAHANFGIVGLTERLDIMTAKLIDAYKLIGVAGSRSAGSDEGRYVSYLSSPIRDKILELNAEDLRLYQYLLDHAAG